MSPRLRFILEASFACSVGIVCFLFLGAVVDLGAAVKGDTASPPHPPQATDRICLSLRALASELAKNPKGREAADLAGIGWIEGFLVDRESRDVILFGRGGSGYPTLHADDLVVAMRNIWGDGPYPFCSLDPEPQNVQAVNRLASQTGAVTSTRQMHEFFEALKKAWGPQSVVVGGVPKNSLHAHVMIDADYHLKKLSQGFVKVEGAPSILDIVLGEAKKDIKAQGRPPKLGMSTSRLWFHVADAQPTFREKEEDVLIEQCAMVVLTEKQRADIDGTLSDVGSEDPHATLFARTVSNRIQSHTAAVPEYAKLVNLFRLHAVLRAMRFRNAAEHAKLNLDYYLHNYRYRMESPMPGSLAGLANSKEERVQIKSDGGHIDYVLFPLVCGGVSMEMVVNEKKFLTDKTKGIHMLRQALIAARPTAQSLSWYVRTQS